MNTKQWVNLYHEHRYFIVSFVLSLVFGVCIDIKPLWSEWFRLIDQEKRTTFQLVEKEQALRQTGLTANKLRMLQSTKIKKPLLDQLIQASEGNRCELRRLQIETKNAENTSPRSETVTSPMLIKMHFDSDFMGFYGFVETLMQQGLPLQLDHFFLQDQGSRIQMSLQFSVFPEILIDESWKRRLEGLRSSCCVRDPFQELPFIPPDPFQNIDLEQLRYVGYVAEAGTTVALVLLPGGHIVDLYPGSPLGKTPWHVLKIHFRYLILMNQQQKKVLRLERTRS